MLKNMSEKDRQRLLYLANHQAEIAASDKMQKIISDWRKHMSDEKNTRPLVTMELGTFIDDIVPPLLQCEDQRARSIEYGFLSATVNHDLFDDDTIVNPFAGFGTHFSIKPFGLDVQVKYAEGSIGHEIIPAINDLEEDFHLLKPSDTYFSAVENLKKPMDNWNEAFGDILPAKRVGNSFFSYPTFHILQLMGMETMFISLMDYPDLFHKMMDMITNDYIAYFKEAEKRGLLYSTADGEYICQGTFAFTEDLPRNKDFYLTSDIWGYLNSQETSTWSPSQYNEFVFPYYCRIAELYGQLVYGCCEPVNAFWDDSISKYPHLRKVSISPWCDEEFMGERLAGSNVVYWRKTSPNFIGVGTTLDEDAARKHIEKTINAAKGCKVEFVQRDVLTVNKDYKKVRRFVEIIKECAEKHVC